MKTNTMKLALLCLFGLTIITFTSFGQGTELKWNDAMNKGGDVATWVSTVIYAVMAIFIMSAIIMGSLAFKQLAADGNWKDFWSKIAGAVGMFVTPIAVYWAMRIQ